MGRASGGQSVMPQLAPEQGSGLRARRRGSSMGEDATIKKHVPLSSCFGRDIDGDFMEIELNDAKLRLTGRSTRV